MSKDSKIPLEKDIDEKIVCDEIDVSLDILDDEAYIDFEKNRQI